MKRTAYLALGANIGDREWNLREAVRLLRESDCDVTAVSPLYQTKPVGMEDQPDFLNAVIEIGTDLTPRQLLDAAKSIEQTLGRVRTIRWGPRVIDVDILIFDGEVVEEPELVLPHPRMIERAFVIVPLADIAPRTRLPNGVTARGAAETIDRTGILRVADSSWSD